MMWKRFQPVLVPALVLATGACQAAPATEEATDPDPVMSAALEQPLLVDPDLSQQNRRHLAIEPPGPVDPALPSPDAEGGFRPEPAP